MYRHVEKLAQEIRKGAASVDMVSLPNYGRSVSTLLLAFLWSISDNLGYNETHKLIMKSLKQNRCRIASSQRNKKTLIQKHRAKSLFLTGTRDAPRRSAL
ncbi:hypothetical protein YC2023_115790 [Brassica napus]